MTKSNLRTVVKGASDPDKGKIKVTDQFLHALEAEPIKKVLEIIRQENPNGYYQSYDKLITYAKKHNKTPFDSPFVCL
jgi:hypothetical protein